MIISPDTYRIINGAYQFSSDSEPGIWDAAYSAFRACAVRKSTLIVMVGLPMSGKTRWARYQDDDLISVFDATSVNAERRKPLVEIAQANGAKVHAVFMDTPANVCRERNKLRQFGPLPDQVMERMEGRLSIPSVDEGFDSVHTITHISA